MLFNVPATDIAFSEKDLVLTMDLPGFTTDDLSLEVRDEFLTVRGERRRPEMPEGTRYAHVERPAGAFERRIRIPRGVDPDAITASLTNGVLSLIVPKPDQLLPKTIEIHVGDNLQQRELETA